MIKDKTTIGIFTADAEETDMIKLPEAKLNDIITTAFVAGMLSGGVVIAVLIIVVDLIIAAISS